jgi:hypothetical protein
MIQRLVLAAAANAEKCQTMAADKFCRKEKQFWEKVFKPIWKCPETEL